MNEQLKARSFLSIISGWPNQLFEISEPDPSNSRDAEHSHTPKILESEFYIVPARVLSKKRSDNNLETRFRRPPVKRTVMLRKGAINPGDLVRGCH